MPGQTAPPRTPTLVPTKTWRRILVCKTIFTLLLSSSYREERPRRTMEVKNSCAEGNSNILERSDSRARTGLTNTRGNSNCGIHLPLLGLDVRHGRLTVGRPLCSCADLQICRSADLICWRWLPCFSNCTKRHMFNQDFLSFCFPILKIRMYFSSMSNTRQWESAVVARLFEMRRKSFSRH